MREVGCEAHLQINLRRVGMKKGWMIVGIAALVAVLGWQG